MEPARGLAKDTVQKTSQITHNREKVRAVLSVVIPARFRKDDKAEKIRGALREARFCYRARIAAAEAGGGGGGVAAAAGGEDEWFPKRGYLHGTLEDIASTVQLINQATRDLDMHVKEATAVIRAAAKNVPAANARAIARVLKQNEGEQTSQMAMAILLNAFVFQEVPSSIDFGDKEVAPTQKNRNADGHVSIPKTVRAWRAILDINYYPIFAMAIGIIEEVSKTAAPGVVDVVAGGADGIVRLVTGAQDVASSVFQSLIADQKILAAFYTRPETAVMIAEVVYPSGPDECGRATIADFACGTGILLHAVYRRLGQAYEAAGMPLPAPAASAPAAGRREDGRIERKEGGGRKRPLPPPRRRGPAARGGWCPAIAT